MPRLAVVSAQARIAPPRGTVTWQRWLFAPAATSTRQCSGCGARTDNSAPAKASTMNIASSLEL